MLRPAYFPARSKTKPRCPTIALLVSVLLNVILILFLAAPSDPFLGEHPSMLIRATDMTWNGGHPIQGQQGTCVCGIDNYCLCSPSLAIDVVLAISGNTDEVWVVQRRDTSQLAVMGGFVQIGETVEDAVVRELKEETGITVYGPGTLLGVYSDPRRDKRRHTVSAVYTLELDPQDQPAAADDVKDVRKIRLDDIANYDFFADHKTILMDFRKWKRDQGTDYRSSKGDFAEDIVRSICVPT